MAETENQKTLLDVCAEIWRGKIFISAGICAGIILAMGFLLTATPHYRAQVILSPANTMNGAEVSSPVAEESLLALRYLAQRMGAANPSDFMRFENTFSGPTVAEMLLKDERVEQDLGDEKALESPSALAEYIDRRVRIDAVGATPMRRMTYLHPDGKFAAYFLRALHHVTDGLIRQKIRQEATQRVRYLQEAAATAGGPYNGFSHAFAGMGVQFVLFAGIDFGIGVLLARRMGLWRRLRAAPLSRSLLLGSRIASGALIALLLVLVIFGAGIAIFGVRIHGSWLGFLMIVGAFALVTSTFGMLVAAFGRTPEATRSLANFGTLVMVMLGGAWVPSFLFPGWVQTLALALPARWVVDGLDAMTWRGLGLQAALAPTAALLGFALLFGLVAVWRFDWEE